MPPYDRGIEVTERRSEGTVTTGSSGLPVAAEHSAATKPAELIEQVAAARHVVLLHGQPGAGSDFDAVVALLPSQISALALDRPGYRTNPLPPSDFAANAASVLSAMDSAGIDKATIVGHSYGGGVALAMLAAAPDRVAGIVLVCSVGPDCLNNWDALLAARIAGPFCSIWAWSLTPWFARARLARIARRRGRPLEHAEFVNWAVWAQARHHHGAMWKTFVVEQRALVSQIDALIASVTGVAVPVLILADPSDTMVPVGTAHALSRVLPASVVRLIDGGGHQLPRRRPSAIVDAIIDLCGIDVSGIDISDIEVDGIEIAGA